MKMKDSKRFEYYYHTQGLDCWHISPLKGNLKPLTLNDGPCGVRKPSTEEYTEQSGIMEAICGVSPSGIAASFSREVAFKNGEVLAEDCINKSVDVLLAPGVNIKRNCLCGRNFEYFSEDPFLSGTLAAEYINGLQEHGVRACLKHYCCNNKEYARMVNSSNVSLRALNEIYLRSFSFTLKNSNPFSIMTSYNKVNGEYVPESNYLLNEKLKKQFNYKGLIMSDWCAVSDKAKTIKNGLHVEMPKAFRSNKYLDGKLNNNEFTEDDLIRNDNEFYNAIINFTNKKKHSGLTNEQLHEICVKNASEVPVLIKNNNNFLPLLRNEKILFIGYSVSNHIFCGSGSAAVNSFYKKTFLDLLTEKNIDFKYILGSDENNLLISEKELKLYSKTFDKVVLFLSDFIGDEEEAHDRETISLRKSQIDLFDIVKKVFKNFATVLICGAVYDVEEIYNDSSAFLINYYSGEGQDEGIFNNLFGNANPSGRLPETWISSLKQNSIYNNLNKHDLYNEYYDDDIYVGYRYYFGKHGFYLPFGYGLSYSCFEYSNIYVKANINNLEISLDITNNSNFSGNDVVQIYVGKKNSNVYRSKYELKAYKKVFVEAYKTQKAKLIIDLDDLSVYDYSSDSMKIEDGEYEIYIAKNSKDIIDCKTVSISGEKLLPNLEIKKIQRRMKNAKVSLDTPCDDVIKFGLTKLKEFLLNYPNINFEKLYKEMTSIPGMPLSCLQFSKVISFDEILNMIDFYNE
ncbi:MAG: glycoside hydrolase family 3 C-terminal domain-containing protein [Treponema sp.]|nr:glycoside hydrolase family 3 C-terminal domain-containing protein [Treponema sp.]